MPCLEQEGEAFSRSRKVRGGGGYGQILHPDPSPCPWSSQAAQAEPQQPGSMEDQREGVFLVFQVMVSDSGEFFPSFGINTVVWSSMDLCGMRPWNSAL